MAIDDRLSIFKNIATQQGYDPGEIEMVTSLAKMAEEQKKKEKETNLESVYGSIEGGLPFDVATQGLKPDERAFVYNELRGRGYSFGGEEIGKEALFSLEADPTAQRQMAQEKRLYTKEELEKQGKAQMEAENYLAGITPTEDLSEEAKTFLRERGEKVKPALSTEQQKAYDTAKKQNQYAQDVLDVLDAIDTGGLRGKEAETALEFAAGQYSKSLFGEGGKQLTEMEVSILQGTNPTIQQRRQNIFQKLTGQVPPQTGKILDSSQELRMKMQLALRNSNMVLGGEVPPISQTFPETPPEKPGLIGEGSLPYEVSKGGYNLIVNPIVQGIKGYAQLVGTAAGTLALPTVSKISPEAGGSLADLLEPTIRNKYATPTQAMFVGGLQTLGGVGATFDIATLGQAGVVKGALTVGARNVAINAPIFATGEALYAARTGGNIEEAAWRGLTGQGTIGPFEGIFGRSPESQAADVVLTLAGPIVGANMARKVISGGVAVDPPPIRLEKNIKTAFLGAVSDVKGRASTSILVPDRQSVVNSEKLAQQAIAITRSRTVRGMAREMPKTREVAGKFIDSRMTQLDKNLKGLPGSEVESQILIEVGKTAAATANPSLFEVFKKELSGLLPSEIPGTPDIGFTDLTTFTRLNEARKGLNKSISSSWFRQDQPLVGRSNNLYQMRWIASQAIKDIIAGTRGAEDVANAIKVQHVAFATEPVLSKAAQTGARSGNSITAVLNVLDTITKPARIEAIRLLERGTSEFQTARNLPQGGGFPEVPPKYPTFLWK